MTLIKIHAEVTKPLEYVGQTKWGKIKEGMIWSRSKVCFKVRAKIQISLPGTEIFFIGSLLFPQHTHAQFARSPAKFYSDHFFYINFLSLKILLSWSMSEQTNDVIQSQKRIKISFDFTFTMLLMIGCSILCLMKYLEEKKVDDL